MKLHHILLIISVYFLVSCTSKKNEQSRLPIISGNIELVQLIPNSTDQFQIYDLVDFDIDSEGKLFILDPSGFTINVFDKDGSFIKSKGREGRGPGEFRNPGNVRLCGDQLLITEPTLGGVHYFDTDLNYIEAIAFKHFILDVSCLESMTIIHSVIQSGTMLGIKKISSEQADDLYYHSVGTLQDGILNTLITELSENGDIYAAYRFRNKILSLNYNGEVNFELSISGWNEMVELSDDNMPKFNLIRSITIDDNGNLLILGGAYSENDGKDVIVYDINQRKFLGYFTLPKKSSKIKWDNSYLYSMDRNNNKVYKWSIDY